MAVTIKSAREIELMREAGKILAVVHDEMAKALKPGMSTMDINRVGEQVIRDFGCTPSFLNYNGYPAAVRSFITPTLTKADGCRIRTVKVWQRCTAGRHSM